ncbi:MAG: hypothetical protein ACKOXI_03315 [Candidatus Planktophila sp.]
MLFPALLLSGSTASATDKPDEQFAVSAPPTNDRYTGINLADEVFAKNSLSLLEAMTSDGDSPESSIKSKQACRSIGEKGCEPGKYFQYSALLAHCDQLLTTDCVSKAFAIDASGREIIGNVVEAFPGVTPYTFAGDPSVGLPQGGSAFIVEFPGVSHQGGNQFLINVYLNGYRGFNEKQFQVENFHAGIFAISKVAGNCKAPDPEPNVRPDSKLRGRAVRQGGCEKGNNNSSALACTMTSSSACALPWALPLDIDFGLTIKLHEKIRGWLHSRLSQAQASITSTSDGDQLLSIQGKPTVVPGIHAWYKKDSLPAPLKSFYSKISETELNSQGAGWPSADGKIINGTDGLPYTILKEGFGYDEGGFKEVSAWINAASDKATYAQTFWSLRSMQSSQFDTCMKGSDSLSGIVSTNSTMYIGAPPTFEKESQSLDYKVMSPHSLPDGEEFKGSYDLAIKSDVARCIYGFSSAPVSAKISILSSDGTTQVATTTFNERNGWMYLVARGFTFSSPTVRVKLIQEAAQVSVLPKKTTIACTKGKSSKKVSAINPSCPSGWKKK